MGSMQNTYIRQRINFLCFMLISSWKQIIIIIILKENLVYEIAERVTYMWYKNWSKYIAIAAVALCAGAGVQAADTAAPDNGQRVVSSYEYSAVSYGNTADGKTYHRVVTTRNGVKESDVTTIDTNDGTLTVQNDQTGSQVQGAVNGVQMKDGAVKAARIDASAGSVGGVVFDGKGAVTGVQTNDADPTSAVSVAYLQKKLDELEEENQKLKAELDALKRQK